VGHIASIWGRIVSAAAAAVSRGPSWAYLAQKEKLIALRDAAGLRSEFSVKSSMDALEWSRMNVGLKMAVLMLAGVDGEVEAIAGKDFREFTPMECAAIRSQLREIRTAIIASPALVRS
jgi:hypothetical protein